MDLKILDREDIDEKRWNGCVHFAISAMPYAYTWYLDNVCEEWKGIVYDNYKIVMPLVIGKKMGIEYLYQPFFTQQLGIFSTMPLNQQNIDEFYNAIPKEYKYIDINFNESNYSPTSVKGEERDNYLLELHYNYETLEQNFSKNLKRKLKKAQEEGLFVATDVKPEQLANFYKKHTAKKIKGFKEKHYYTILRIVYKALSYQMGVILGVKNKEGELLAVNFLINHPQRIINLLPSSSKEGLEKNAMAVLLNHIIQYNAGQKKYLDFEGSMIAGIARFYASFGAKPAKYFRIKTNHLPKILRIFKK
ncbi:MAG: GNAT family N-acetyltransferase [Chitinophagales bacterium]